MLKSPDEVASYNTLHVFQHSKKKDAPQGVTTPCPRGTPPVTEREHSATTYDFPLAFSAGHWAPHPHVARCDP